jgi:hypothetical protein
MVGRWRIEMAWQHRLPDGVRHEGSSSEGFTLSVSLPVDEDGLAPLQCPADAGHRFKVTLTQSPSGQSSNCYCPYCGTRAATDEFLADQLPRLDAAMEAAAEQYAHQTLEDMLSKAFGKPTGPRSRSGLFDVTISYQPGRPPPRRMLPTYDIEPTRRTMRCNRCGEAFAVYGLAIYCPSCGQLAPAQQLVELVRVQCDRLAALDGLDAQRRRDLVEAGVVTSIYESTFKDGFGALETYLKDRFQQEAKSVAKPPATTTFQRLLDTNELYQQQLGVDLEAAVGAQVWAALLQAAAIRHVLTHNAGVIDAKFLTRVTGWPQRVGERLQVRRADADRFLDVLEQFAAAVL